MGSYIFCCLNCIVAFWHDRHGNIANDCENWSPQTSMLSWWEITKCDICKKRKLGNSLLEIYHFKQHTLDSLKFVPLEDIDTFKYNDDAILLQETK